MGDQFLQKLCEDVAIVCTLKVAKEDITIATYCKQQVDIATQLWEHSTKLLTFWSIRHAVVLTAAECALIEVHYDSVFIERGLQL